MDTHLMRIDLSPEANDFEPVALEPGVPLADRAGANYAILRRWFGGAVAEPVWSAGAELRFHLRDDQQGRLTQAVCQPAKREDLAGPCRAAAESLVARLEKIKPASPSEQALHRAARTALAPLVRPGEDADGDGSFFKVREGSGPWQLVWCWGYRRKDHEPATPVVCSSSDCKHLFLRRPKAKARCPGCSKVAEAQSARATTGRRASVALFAVAATLAGLALFAAVNPPQLIVEPSRWTGPEGSRVEFRVTQRYLNIWSRDVTARVASRAEDCKVIEFDAAGGAGQTRAPGQTEVLFRYQNYVAAADVEVTAAIEPAQVAQLPSDATAPTGDVATKDASDANGPAASAADDNAGASAPKEPSRSEKEQPLADADVPVAPRDEVEPAPVSTESAATAAEKIAQALKDAVNGSSNAASLATGPSASQGDSPHAESTSAATTGSGSAARSDIATHGPVVSTASQPGRDSLVQGATSRQISSAAVGTGDRAVVSGSVVSDTVVSDTDSHGTSTPVAVGTVTHELVDGAVVRGPVSSTVTSGAVTPVSVSTVTRGPVESTVVRTVTDGHVVPVAVGSNVVVPGAIGSTTHLPNTVESVTTPVVAPGDFAVCDVRPVSVRPFGFTHDMFQAEVKFDVTERARYRLVDARGNGLTEWFVVGPSATTSLTSGPIRRVAGDDYELFIERDLNGAHKLFQTTFRFASATTKVP